jgi:hypothetical protein
VAATTSNIVEESQLPSLELSIQQKQAREEEVRRRIKDMILSKLTEEELAKVLDEHKRLSQAIGFSVGIHAAGEQSIESKRCIVDEMDAIMDDKLEGKVKSQNRDFLLSFLRVRIIF